jgi:hypothetical protein
MSLKWKNFKKEEYQAGKCALICKSPTEFKIVVLRYFDKNEKDNIGDYSGFYWCDSNYKDFVVCSPYENPSNWYLPLETPKEIYD